jgi:phenylpyruvate tautomerase PptA (4-oxalocrotonate tautomerase family)
MPHLTVHALEADLAGRESALAESLTDAVVDVYGEWARELVTIRMVGMPTHRSFVAGRVLDAVAPSVTFGISESAYPRPDADTIVANLIARVTDAVASVFGEATRAGIRVELVATPADRSGVGGVVASIR